MSAGARGATMDPELSHRRPLRHRSLSHRELLLSRMDLFSHAISVASFKVLRAANATFVRVPCRHVLLL